MKQLFRHPLFFLIIVCLVPGCSQQPPEATAEIQTTWKLVRNVTTENPTFQAALTIKNNSDVKLTSKNWRIYFNLRYHGHELTSVSPDLTINHVSGDLFYLSPANNFKGLAANDSVTIGYEGKRRIANFQDVPTGLFFVKDSLDTSPITLKNPTVVTNTDQKLIEPDPAAIYNKNDAIINIPGNQLPQIFPTPAHYTETGSQFVLDDNTVITGDNVFEHEAQYLVREFEKVLGHSIKIKNETGPTSIILKRKSLANEAYHLKIDSRQILIEAEDAAGIFYGIQSLKTMLPAALWKSPKGSVTLKGVDVSDAPRFPVRSFVLDVARNFQPKEEILKILDIMALYKLNVFHFHLNDDEGWRLEIQGLPELTEVGSKRGYPFDKNHQLPPSYGSGAHAAFPGSGFYTKADYIEIVKFAHARHIRVVPEIESPGHARAAIKAMQNRYDKYLKEGFEIEAERYLLNDKADQSTYMSNQFFNDNVMNVALPSTYIFIEKVVDEIVDMHKAAGAPLTAMHMAGDEVPFGSWERSPAVAAFRKENPTIASAKDLWAMYFERVKAILRKRGLSIYGWQELVVGTQTEGDGEHVINTQLISDDLQIDAWWNMNGNEDIPYKLANAGYKTVLANFDHLYFDLAYEPSFGEPGDAWVGYLDVERVFAFIPYDYYRNFKTDVRGVPHPANFFDGKERLTDAAKANIVGVQGSLWGENLISTEIMEYLLVPRLLALAERCWSPDPMWARVADDKEQQKLYDSAWSTFVHVLGKRELPRLNYYAGGIGFRIPTPGAIVTDGHVVVNMQIPGFDIRYTTDGTDPGIENKIYTGPIADKKLIKLRAFDPRGRSSHMISILNN